MSDTFRDILISPIDFKKIITIAITEDVAKCNKTITAIRDGVYTGPIMTLLQVCNSSSSIR